MNKKQKEEVKRLFLEKHKDTSPLVKCAEWQMTIKDIEEQESWRRK